jgi:hypothetical protein
MDRIGIGKTNRADKSSDECDLSDLGVIGIDMLSKDISITNDSMCVRQPTVLVNQDNGTGCSPEDKRSKQVRRAELTYWHILTYVYQRETGFVISFSLLFIEVVLINSRSKTTSKTGL